MVVPWRWRCDFEYHGNIVGIVEHIPKGDRPGRIVAPADQGRPDQTPEFKVESALQYLGILDTVHS